MKTKQRLLLFLSISASPLRLPIYHKSLGNTPNYKNPKSVLEDPYSIIKTQNLCWRHLNSLRTINSFVLLLLRYLYLAAYELSLILQNWIYKILPSMFKLGDKKEDSVQLNGKYLVWIFKHSFLSLFERVLIYIHLRSPFGSLPCQIPKQAVLFHQQKDDFVIEEGNNFHKLGDFQGPIHEFYNAFNIHNNHHINIAPFKFDVPSPDDLVSNGLWSSRTGSKANVLRCAFLTSI
ncbi:hypothetical protein L3X38_005996 [Prunus dulcis]|uniref:Uncharacterized protein n=1 Tax=Prunus dulcis TaxID=3755 RepID=A0AAD5F4N8_PRUDU|nr:hypothetical protein L3X38_005996 [Prunus dulcis]